MTSFSQFLVATLVCVSFVACKKDESTAKPVENKSSTQCSNGVVGNVSGPDIALDPSLTVASVDGLPITVAQLDTHLADEENKMTQEYIEKMHQLRQQGLEEMIADSLSDIEAKKLGISREELLKKEVFEKTPAPSPLEIEDAYNRYLKGKVNVTFAEAKDRLTQQMMQEKSMIRAKQYFDELKSKYKIRQNLPQPKLQKYDVESIGPSKGSEMAPVTIVEFSDFQCPFCKKAAATVDDIVKMYGDKVRLVFRQSPLAFHEKAPKAAEAALCAHEQNSFWAMHDKLFGDQEHLDVADLKQRAVDLKLDTTKFNECLDSSRMAGAVKKDSDAAAAAKLTGTPAFIINGRLLSGAQPFEAFRDVIDAALAPK